MAFKLKKKVTTKVYVILDHPSYVLLQNLSRGAVIHDAENKPMPAIDVFSIVVGHLKEKLLVEIKIQNNAITDDDILYVLTVPAIWSDAAKQFMREAATSQNVRTST